MNLHATPPEYEPTIAQPRQRRRQEAFDRDAEAELQEASGLRKYAPAIVIGAAALGAIGAAFVFFRSSDDLPRKLPPEITVVNILPPPPPPPPPPPEQKMIEQTPVKQEEFQEQKPVEEAKQEPKDDPKPQDAKDEPLPGPLSLDAKAVGPGDAFGLGGKPGGRGLIGGGGGGGSKWGWYASIVQSQVESALHTNTHTRSVVMQMKLRLWADASGRVSRIQIDSSSGNPEVDTAVQSEVLAGLTLREPPPKDMPMPIVMRITTRRPG